ncbi:kinase [Sphingomonas sp. PAMC 26617]|uniref:kinase n=1 Tax=Sphingomonas sp. PAMC 26617 TaxID=1112216 RepID=UPI0002886914|nr:kinase [Sphingomonas sp. PAMC 26617]
MSPDEVIGDFIAARLATRTAHTPLVVGLCGAQGSGKSTIAAGMARRFDRTAVLSLDDLYLRRADREALARAVHPLFATRGVPGTHDVTLGLEVLGAVDRGEPVALPRFDKTYDDRAAVAQWPKAPAPCDLLIFEGWCVGATPQDSAALAAPVNGLERDEDSKGDWRTASNAALADAYQSLFARIDALVLLATPDFATVLAWRREQENALRVARPGPAVMDDAAVARFVAHYERLTRHILAEMPSRADLVVPLTASRQIAMPIDSARSPLVTFDA